MAWYYKPLEVDLSEFDEDRTDYSNAELEAYTDALLRQDIKENGNKHHILFREHLAARDRRELKVGSGVVDETLTNLLPKTDRPGVTAGDGQMMYNRCVDLSTEALTRTGWKQAETLTLGEDIWTYDPVSDSCYWSPLLEIYIDEYKGPVDVMESYTISSRTTPGHRWIVVTETDRNVRFETRELKPRFYIPLGRDPKFNLDDSEDDLYELLGWVLTDGSYHQENGARIYQAIHNPKVAALQLCLEANGVDPIWQTKDKNDVGHWYIPARVGSKLRAIAPVKKLSAVDTSELEIGRKKSLMRGLIYGDGYLRRNERELYSTSKSEIDAAQALATTMGITSSTRVAKNPKAFCPIEYTLRLKENRGSRWAYVRNAYKGQESFSGSVWCPRVDSGFWVARRNGRVYVTGNTHPKGRKVNSKEQRLRNGASYYR